MKYSFKKCKRPQDEILAAVDKFGIKVEHDDNNFSIIGAADDIDEFLTFCADFDEDAKNELIVASMLDFDKLTPESSLEIIEKFVNEHGGFEGSDIVINTLKNAIEI